MILLTAGMGNQRIIRLIFDDVEKLFVEKESLDKRGLTEDDLSVDVEIINSSEMKKLITDSEVMFNF